MAEADVVLYGATGYTGRLVAAELDRLGASFAVAGRDGAKLAALSASLPTKPPVLVARLDDAAALERVAASGRVLLAAAGPFQRTGPPLVAAALAARRDYVDITGEQAFMRWTLERDAAARDAGVALVNAVGFDVVPSDLACVLAARRLGRVDALDVAIASRGGMSRGTRRSAAEMAGRGWWFDGGRYRWGPPGRFARGFRFPEPLGRRAAAFVPWGDVVTAPRSTGARRVRTFFTMPPRRARALRALGPLLDLAARAPGVRGRLARRAAGAPEGPDEARRAAATFTILAEATDGAGATARGVVSGRDPYGLTGATAAAAAVALARGEARERRGALAPSQAFDLERMLAPLAERFSLAWRAE